MVVSMMAPGQPGIAPTWTSSAKDLISTALGPSRLWATFGYGIVNEVYWPSTGQPQIRDLGFIVAGGKEWFEVKRVQRYTLTVPQPYIPLPTFIHEGDTYRLTLECVPDPLRDVLLIRYQLEGEGMNLYALLAPHLGPDIHKNRAWVEKELYAQGGDNYLCLASDQGLGRGSAGFVGVSDGWQDFSQHGGMTWTYPQAEDGNVALMAELPSQQGVLALGFAASREGARTLARSSLSEGFTPIRKRFTEGWQSWGEKLVLPKSTQRMTQEAQLSAAVLKLHEDKSYPGAVVASLSIPWGNSHDDLGGYHLVWARDAVEAGLGLLAAGQVDDAKRMLSYLIATQQEDGHWTQNFYPDGHPFWTGIQLDEVSFPILLAGKLQELNLLSDVSGARAMVRAAAGYLVRNGPLSPQDRWEENAGANPFTLAAEIAALVVAGSFLEGDEREYVLSLADDWNERVEEWTYVRHSQLAQTLQVDGYYVRLSPPEAQGGLRGRVEVRNRAGETLPAEALVGLEFLYLVRLGLRSPHDPKIRASLVVAEAMLKVETPCGPSYHRYNEDGYGEHENGDAFDGTGIGRAWPLLTGERGHYALQAGEAVTPYLEAMCCMTGTGGLIPEQVWDRAALTSKGLEPGKPSGSAMPLVWAHAEFLKLLYSQASGKPLELLNVVAARYGTPPTLTVQHWRKDVPLSVMRRGRQLMIERDQPFTLHYSTDAWKTVADVAATPLPFGLFGVLLDTQGFEQLVWTLYYPHLVTWEGQNYDLQLL
jgi:glucoamylase